MTKKEEVRFYCKWCDTMKPIDELAEIVTDKEYVTWAGCRDCHMRKRRLDGNEQRRRSWQITLRNYFRK